VGTLIWFSAAFVLVLVLLTIGLATAALVHREGMSPGEDLMVALGGGIAVLAVAAVAQLPLPFAFTTVSPPLVLVLLAASAFILWRRRAWLRTLPSDPQFQLVALSAGALFTIGLTVAAQPWDRNEDIVGGAGTVGSFHIPDMPGDTLLQYRTAQILQNRLPIETTPYYADYWYISDRTPLVGLVTTFVTASAGIRLPEALEALGAPYQLIDPYGYWLYRQISILTNAMVVASAVLVAWELLGPRVAKLGAVFTILSPFVLINVVFHWPKLLVGFFIAGFYFWSYVRRRPVLAGVFAAGGVLSHPVGALFLPAMFVYLLLARHWRQLLTSGAVAAAVLFPWFFWTSVIYHHASRMLTYPLGVALSDPTNPGPEIRGALEKFTHRPLWSILNDRWELVRNTFLAWQFPHAFLSASGVRDIRVAVYESFRITFPGIFGAGLAIFGFASFKRIVTQPFWGATLGGSTLVILIFWGIPSEALTISAFQPVTGLWICLATALLARLPVWAVRSIVLVTALEWCAFTYLLLYRTPPVVTWRLSWTVLFLFSLALIAGVTWAGWRWAELPAKDEFADRISSRTGRGLKANG
jgi:hypothetical protein